jgi:hypothetical protein
MKTAKETNFNHTMVGKAQKSAEKIVTYSLYNPHNYRLYFKFTKNGYKPMGGMVGVWFGKFKNYNSEFSVLGDGVRIIIKKNQAEVINKLTEEQWYSINKSKAKEEISAILNNIDEKCKNSLKNFITTFGGETDYIILKTENRPKLNMFIKSDNKVMQETYIDSLPLDMQFETDIVKKVYKQKNIEFKEPIYAARYLENAALQDFSPQITDALKEVTNALKNIYLVSADHKDAFNKYAGYIEMHLDSIQKISQYMQDVRDIVKTNIKPQGNLEYIKSNIMNLDDIFKYKDIISTLSIDEKQQLEQYIMDKFKN